MNIIEVRHQDIHEADQAFNEFMFKTEQFLNEQTKGNNTLYKDCSGSQLETVALKALHEVSSSTIFRKEEIKLISGARFPDIVAERYYGVEVKSTKEDKWQSTGSSIVESSRIEDVSRIYMLFGKLGGKFAEFRCKPYQDCLSNIAVTHSPRYLIDMDLTASNSATIFGKIGIEYDDFRLLNEAEKIAHVRAYYKQQAIAHNKTQMPWWMGEEQIVRPVISLYSELSPREKHDINVRMFILFIDDILNSDYKRAALWMCSRYSVINPSMRDTFSAGGQVHNLGSTILSKPIKQVFGRLYEMRQDIVSYLKHPDYQMEQDIVDCWTQFDTSLDYLQNWLNRVQKTFSSSPYTKKLDICELYKDVL